MMIRSFHVFHVAVGLLLMLAANALLGQAIDWHSIDAGGGVSSAGDVVLQGVVGQTDTVRMEGGSVTISGGLLPLPAELIFENKFE